MKKLLFILFILPSTLFSQIPVSILRDTTISKNMALILSNDSIIKEGGHLKTGRGSLANGDYKYIHSSQSSWLVLAASTPGDSKSGIISLPRRYNGLQLSIKAIKKEGNKKRGYKYIIKVGVGNIVNYEIELEDAIAVGEIIEPAKLQSSQSSASPVGNSPSEELAKFKRLLDSGAINQSEYDSIKKKILNKM